MKRSYFDDTDHINLEKSLSELRNAKFTDSGSKYQRPDFKFEIDEWWPIKNNERYQFKGLVPAGSSMLVDGKEKSLKTSFVAMLLAAALSDDGYYENVRCTLNINSHMIWFDTEQNKGEFNSLQSKIKRMAGLDKMPDNYHAYSLKRFGDPVEKLMLMLKVINDLMDDANRRRDRNGNLRPEDKIGIVVIDQIADLLDDENDRQQVNQLFNLFDELQEDSGAIFIYVLHQNKNDKKPTGTIGYKALKKISTRVSAEKTDENDPLSPSYIVHTRSRAGEIFTKFLMGYNDQGLIKKIEEDIWTDKQRRR